MTTGEVVALVVPLAIVFFMWLLAMAAVDVHRGGSLSGGPSQRARRNRIGGLWRQRHRW